jgi:hypothetical protein
MRKYAALDKGSGEKTFLYVGGSLSLLVFFNNGNQFVAWHIDAGTFAQL